MDLHMDSDAEEELLEKELDSRLASPTANTKKRNKVIDLDDLLNECKKDEERLKKRKSKSIQVQKHLADDEDKTEKKLSKAVNEFHELIKEIDGKDNVSTGVKTKNCIPDWGLQVFGPEKLPSPLGFPDLGSSMLLKTFAANELSSLVDMDMERGEVFLQGLLLNGWLGKLALEYGHLEESIAIWSFNLLLHSSDESLRLAACDFWHTVLAYNKVDVSLMKIQWLPSFSHLKDALEAFGFLFCCPSNISSNQELNASGYNNQGVPTNIRAWIKIVTACCQARSKHSMISNSQGEELLGIVVLMFLDKRLEGLSLALHECLQSAIHFFEEEDWITSCERVAKLLAERVPRDMNCLRIVHCISGIDSRSKQFRSRLAFEVLKTCFEQVADVHDFLRKVISINLKDRSCDLFTIYLYLVLIENSLIADDLDNRQAVDEKWRSFLRNCCSQIANTDFRQFAQEVRSKASYLLQGQETINYRNSQVGSSINHKLFVSRDKRIVFAI